MRNFKKTLALALVLVMVCAMMVPALAATNQTISLSYDGALQYKNGYTTGTRVSIPLHVEGERQVSKVTVTSGEYVKEITSFDTATSDTIDTKTTYTVSSTLDTDNIRTITLATSAIYVDLDIAVETAETTYTVRANSGTYGENSNYGSTGAPTATASEDELVVKGGESYSVSFTPVAGLEIKSLNIRANYSNKANIVSVTTTNATVSGQTFTISKNETTGVVTVSCSGAKRDMFITALTDKASTKYTLSVSTDAFASADVVSEVLPVNSTRAVTFSPVSGYYIETVSITDGDNTGIVTSGNQTAYINGHTYTLRYNVDGSAELSVPAMTADVKVSAATSAGKYYVVVEGKGIYSNYEDLTYVKDGSSVSVVITPEGSTTIDDIYVESTLGNALMDPDDDSFILGGVIYRVGHQNDKIILYLNPIPGNTHITVNGDTWTNVVTADADRGAEVVGSSKQTVDTGDDCSVTFKPVNNYEIEEISVTMNGKTYTAKVTRDYITVNGSKCPITVSSTGRVTVKFYDVDDDIYVEAVTDYVGSSSSSTSGNLVTKSSTSRVSISTNPSYVEYGDSVTITVKATGAYNLDTVTLTSGGSSVTVGNRTSFTLNGQRFTVEVNNATQVRLYCSNLTKRVSVSAKTVVDSDTHDFDDDYHEAYMYGVGGNQFAPETEMTRAEAVALLARLYSDMDDSDLKDWDTDSQFEDVRESAWYAPYIVWAEDNGYLDDLHGYTYKFYPTSPITRAEFVDLVCRFDGGYDKTGYSLYYGDMNWGHWASRQIAYATGMGWVNGYEDETFGPEDSLTRCQVVAIVNRVTGRDGANIVPNSYYNLTTFSDVPETHWAYEEILEATNDHYVVRTTGAGEVWE